MATTVAWADVMYAGASTTDPDYIWRFKNKPEWMLYFVFFMIISSFLILNLFIGIVISKFYREREKLGRNFILND